MAEKVENKQNYTIPIIVMFLLFGMISFVTNLASPMGDILKHQFHIPNWQGTLGVFANFIAYAVMGIPSGNLFQVFLRVSSSISSVPSSQVSACVCSTPWSTRCLTNSVAAATEATSSSRLVAVSIP